MKKKFLGFIVVTLLVILSLSVFAAEDTVYLDGTGETDGAYTDISEAVSALANGGTIVVCGDTTVGTTSAGVTLPEVGGALKIVGKNGVKLTIARAVNFFNDVEIDNITLVYGGTSAGYGSVIMRGNDLTIGENVTCEAVGSHYLSIFGGRASSTQTGDPHIVIKSGTFRRIFAGNSIGTFTGNPVIEIYGATVGPIGKCDGGTFNGTSTVKLYSGANVGAVTADSITIDLTENGSVTAASLETTPVVVVPDGAEYTTVTGDSSITYMIAGEEIPTTVYLDGTGETAGAYTDISEAISKLKKGGTLIVCGNTTVGTSSAALSLPDAGGDLKIVGENDAKLILARVIRLANNTEIDNITLVNSHASYGNIICLGNNLTIGENVIGDTTAGTRYITIYGGAGSGTTNADPHIIVKSGTFRGIYGGNSTGTFNGNPVVEVYGAVIKTIVKGGSEGGTFNGTSTVKLYSGANVGKVYGDSITIDLTESGSVTVTSIDTTPSVIVPDGCEYKTTTSDSGITYEITTEEIPTVVYLDGTGATEGAYTDPEEAVSALQNGGTLIVCGDTTFGTSDEALRLPAINGKLTITGRNGAKLIIARSLTLQCETEIDNIELCNTSSSLGTVIMRGNALTIGENVTTSTTVDRYLSIYGGAASGTVNYDSHITIKSGYFRNVYGGNSSGTFNGDAYVELFGGTVHNNLYGGNEKGTFGGTSTLIMHGGSNGGKAIADNIVIDLQNSKSVSATSYSGTVQTICAEGYEAKLTGTTYSPVLIGSGEDLTPKTLYVDGTGKTEDAYQTIEAALADMPGGGTLIICGDTKVNSAVTLPSTKAVTITSKHEGEDYTENAKLLIGGNITLGGDTTFCDITLEKTSSGQVYLIANGNHLTVEESVISLNYTASVDITVVGGALNTDFTGDSHITLEGGTWRNIYGGNYTGKFTGNTYINILGGTYTYAICGGSYNGDFKGDAHLTVGGNAVMIYTDGMPGVVGGTLGVSGGAQRIFEGNIYLTLCGNCSISANVMGGARRNNVTVNGDVSLTVKEDPYVYFSIYAGGYGSALNGDVSVSISGGDLQGSLYGGAYSGKVTGDVTIDVFDGRLCYYKVNRHSSMSSTPGTQNIYGGGSSSSTLDGNASVTIHGGSIYGGVYGSGSDSAAVTGEKTVNLYGGTIFGGVHNADVSKIDLSGGNSLSLGEASAVDTMVGGKLTLAANAPLTVGTLSGSTELQINGTPLPIDYIIAGTEATNTQVSYVGEGGETLLHSDGVYSIDFAGAHKSVTVTVNYKNGCSARMRKGGDSGSAVLAADSATSTSATYTLVPGLYTVTVVYNDSNNQNYIRKALYVTGREAAQTVTVEFDATNGSGFDSKRSSETTDEILEAYYNTDDIIGCITPDTPYFNDRPGSLKFSTNAEIKEFLAKKDADCSYLYVFDLGKSPSGYSIPIALFTMDELEDGITFEEAAEQIQKQSGRDILLILGGLHGNEPTGSEGTLAFIAEMCTDYGRGVLTDTNVGAIAVIPRVNPEGFYAFTRDTSQPAGDISNINRDYFALTNAETAAVSKAHQLLQPTLTVDCHEAPGNPIWSAGDLLTDTYDVGVSHSPQFNSPLFDGIAATYGDRNVANNRMDEIENRVVESLTNRGFHAYHHDIASDPTHGTHYFGINGSIAFTLEIAGIDSGNTNVLRRTNAQLYGLKTLVSEVVNSDGEIAAYVYEARKSFAEKTQLYDGKTPVVLAHTRSRQDDTAEVINVPLIGADATVRVADNPIEYFYYDIAVRYRTLPTAYVISKELESIGEILNLLDKHGVNYFELPTGTTLALRQYGGSATTATLAAQKDAEFSSGAYIIPVDGYRAFVTALLFEPDNTDSDSNITTLVQMGYLATTDIYRSEESFIAAKLGLSGTYIEIAVPAGKTVASAVVDGVAYDTVNTEGGNAYIVASESDYYAVTLNFTDGTSETVNVGNIRGDMNGDNSITVHDVLMLIKVLLNNQTVEKGDLNGDGKINLIDVIRVMKIVAQ